LPQKIFSVQEEPPTWDDDDAAGLESVSEPDLSDEDGVARPIPGGDEEELLADPELVTLDTRPTLRQAPRVSVEEEEWDAPSPIPILGGVIDRSATPNSIPVLVERPSMDMPKNAIPASPSLGRGQSGNGDGRALMDEGEDKSGGERGGREEEEDMATSMDMGQPRRPTQGPRGMMRQRTDSWVKPERPDDI
jgi:cysteine protease ATG4